MKKISISLLFALLFSGCVTSPPSTGFVAASSIDSLGYTIHEISPHVYTAVYRGNARTLSINAYTYTILAAIEYCSDHQMLTVVGTPQNFSSSQTYTAIGMNSVPYYHRSGKVSYSNEYYSYPVTNVYPNYASGFECQTQFKDLAGSPNYEVLSRELVHDVSKDYRGGLLIKSAKEWNAFQSDDVLIRVNGFRVEQPAEVRTALEKVSEDKVNVDVIRAQKITHLSAPVEDLTARVKEDQTQFVEASCKLIPTSENLNGFDQQPVEIPKICESIVAAAKNKKNER